MCEEWSDGVLEYWSVGRMAWCKNGRMNYWNNGILEFRPIVPTFQYSIIPGSFLTCELK
jgi:hypothetical protein